MFILNTLEVKALYVYIIQRKQKKQFIFFDLGTISPYNASGIIPNFQNEKITDEAKKNTWTLKVYVDFSQYQRFVIINQSITNKQYQLKWIGENVDR